MPIDHSTLDDHIQRLTDVAWILKSVDTLEADPLLPVTPELVQRKRSLILRAVRVDAESELATLRGGRGVSFAWVSGAWTWAAGHLPTIKQTLAVLVFLGLAVGLVASNWHRVGPSPDPAPQPIPQPQPAPSPAPIAVDGLRVLFFYESQDAQDPKAVIFNGKLRSWLNANCAVVNKQPEWRQYDQHMSATDLENESKIWQDAVNRKRDPGEWLIVSNGKTGYEGKMPTKDPDELIAFIGRFK